MFDRKTTADSRGQLLPAPPEIPPDVKQRFPSMREWERRQRDYMQQQVGKPE